VHWGAAINRDPAFIGRQQAALAALADAGDISPSMYPPFSMDNAKRAFDDLAHRKTTGKVVIEL